MRDVELEVRRKPNAAPFRVASLFGNVADRRYPALGN